MVRKRKAEVACRFYAKYGSCNDPHCLLEHQDKEPRREYHSWHGSWGQKGEDLQKVEFEATEPHVYRFVQEYSSVNSSSDENLRTPVQQSRVEELQELEGADEFDVADWTRVLPALPKKLPKKAPGIVRFANRVHSWGRSLGSVSRSQRVHHRSG